MDVSGLPELDAYPTLSECIAWDARDMHHTFQSLFWCAATFGLPGWDRSLMRYDCTRVVWC